MKKNLEHYILHLNKFVDKNLCKNILINLKEKSFEKHTFYNPRTKTEKSLSDNQELETNHSNFLEKKELLDKLWYAIKNYMTHIDFSWYNEWTGYTDIRFNKYLHNKKMALHCDHIHSMFDGEVKGIPILSIVGLLNDNFEGGDFIMFDNYKINFKEGDVIIFPSNFLYPHKVTPIKKGVRYSFVSWVY
jgi:predicted 2-oxoglutarate/Fe(II)-dependent dioxygenase YbiX